MIKELQEENGVENVQEGNNVKEPSASTGGGNIKVDGKVKVIEKKKKKGCGC